MKLAEFARDMTQAPSSEDQVVVSLNGTDYEVAAIQFVGGKVTILTAEDTQADPGPQPVALSEQTAADQQAFSEDGSVPGHADVLHEVASGEGIASDVRAGDVKTEPFKEPGWSDRGQEYHSGPEQPAVPVEDDQVSDDSGT